MDYAGQLLFEFRPYRRPFRQPLKTSHGSWKCRQGIILKLTSQTGHCGFGEVAPLPWFGTETLEQAIAFCRQLPQRFSPGQGLTILPTLPACNFGFELAFKDLMRNFSQSADCPRLDLPAARSSALLPTGAAALSAWPALWELGHRTFKWKIGTAPVAEEIGWLQALMAQLPLGARLRLDANGGLSELAAHHLLDQCDRLCHRIEYVEQPLPPECFPELMRLTDRYQTPIALDESITTLEQLKTHYYRGWQGIYVIKAAIFGAPSRLKQFCQEHPIDLVLSSVFETDIGRQALIDLTAELNLILPFAPQRVLGMGTQQWLPNDGLDDSDWEALWQRLV